MCSYGKHIVIDLSNKYRHIVARRAEYADVFEAFELFVASLDTHTRDWHLGGRVRVPVVEALDQPALVGT